MLSKIIMSTTKNTIKNAPIPENIIRSVHSAFEVKTALFV